MIKLCKKLLSSLGDRLKIIFKFILNLFQKVLLWEIVTLGSTPYPGMSGSEVTVIFTIGFIRYVTLGASFAHNHQ